MFHGPELLVIVDDKHGKHRLNIFCHRCLDCGEAMVKRFQKIGEMLGAEYSMRTCDPWNQKPDESPLCSAPLEITI